jgi:FMN phosphatase YigB (HAD superfamily)
MRVLAAPRAILLDYGGVLVESPPGWSVDHVVPRLVELTGGAVTAARAAADLRSGQQAYGLWCGAMARSWAPPEVSHARFWGDFVCADWPREARMAVLGRASELIHQLVDRGGDCWRIRDGVVDLLDLAGRHGIGLAVVSNTLCGAVFRGFLDREGLADRFAVHLYSDEAGLRKPNPELARRAVAAMGVAPADCWFVGDQLLRDVLCARRAGIGTVIQVREPGVLREHDRAADGWPAPDHHVDSMIDVHALLVTATETR